jgi:methylmalonyl-CoA mutase C-terminal domain/subunit
MKKTRVLIGMLGMDQHEIGALTVAHLLRDAGMEVVYTGRFNTPAGLVKTGMEEGVDMIGISCHSWEYLHFLPELFERIEDKGLEIPVVVGGSVITPSDATKIKEMGVAAAFGPSSTKAEIVETITQIVPAKD